MAIHNDVIQGLLNVNAGGIADLNGVDTYIESGQVDFPANTTLDGHGAILKAHPSFYQNIYNGQYDLHKFLLNMLGNGSIAKNFTIDGDNKQLWGGILVKGLNCHIEDVNVNKTWFSGVWFEEADGGDILRGTMTDAANVPGNWATGMIEMRDIVGLTIDGVTFIDTLNIGCGGVKAKAFSETNVRHLEDVTIKNCDFDLFKWHGWTGGDDGTIGNYAIELSKNRIKNLQILDNRMNTTISVAGDYDHDVDYNYGKLIVKRNHFYPEHQSSNVLETSQSGVDFQDNYIEGGGFVISNFLNWVVAGVIDPYFNLRFNNNVFYFPNTRPTALFRFAREYNTVELKNNTIYGPTGIREVLNFADATCDGTNIDFNQNTITCFGADTLLKSGVNYTDLDTTDNKWHGAFNGVAENVGSIPFKNSGTKPFPFFETLHAGYGAVDPNASATAPDAPSNLLVTSVTNDSISLSWSDNSDNETGFELEHSPNGTDTWTTIAINDNTETHSHGGLSQGQTLHYRIRAINSVGNSAYSNIVSGATSTGTADVFYDRFDVLTYEPPWRDIGLGTKELSTLHKVDGANALKLTLPAVKGVYNSWGGDAKAQIDFFPDYGVLPLRYPPWFTNAGESWAVYLPDTFRADDQFTTAIGSRHQAAQPGSPFTGAAPLSFYIQNGYFRITHRTAPVGDVNAIVPYDYPTIMQAVPGHWYFFVVNTHWDYRVDGNGFHKIYLSMDVPPTLSDIVVDHNGGTGYNDTAIDDYTAYPHFTVYKWDWGDDNDVQTSWDQGITEVVMYVDAITIQNDLITVPTSGISTPAAPSNLGVTGVTDSSISLSWIDNATNEDNIILEHSPNGVDTWTEVSLPANTETFDHTGLAIDITIFYRVKAVNTNGSSAYTLIVSGTTSTGVFTEIFDSLSYDPPWIASGLGVQELSGTQKVIGSSSLRLYLAAVKGVYDADNSRAQIEYSPSVPPPKYPPNLTTTGQKFAVYIPSSDEVNDQFTTLIYAQRQADSPEFTSSAPFSIYLQNGYFRITHRTEDTGNKGNISQVDDVQVMSLTAGHWYFFVINSHWDYNLGGNGFHKVYISIDVPPTQSNIKIAYTGPTGYNDTANTSDTVKTWFTNYKWDWGVDANVDLSTGAGITGSELFFDDILIQSNEIDVPLGSGQVPIIPSNLRIAAKTTSQLTIAWNDNSTDEDNFILSHSPNGTDTWTEVLIQANTTSYPHSGLSENQTVYYKIRATNIYGETADTGVINGTTEITTTDIFTDDFELVSTNPPWRDDVGQNPPTRDATHKLSGTYAQRFYIPVATNYTNARSQKQFQGDAASNVTWYVPYPLPEEGYTRGFSVAVYIPSDFEPDLWNEILLQHKNSPDPGLSGLDNNPSWSLGIKGKNYSTGSGMEIFCTIRYIAVNPTSDPNDKKTIENDNIATVVPGQWHYFVVNTHWNYRIGGNGYHKVYMKVGSPPTVDDIILNYNNPTGYNAQYFGSVYLNIYKWDWNNNVEIGRAQDSIDAWNALGVPSNLQKREVWMDDFRMQESAIALSSGGTIPNAPTSLTLDVVTYSSIEVSWIDNSTDETSFTLSYSPDGANWTDVVLNANSTSFIHNNLGEEETVYYKVRADNAVGSSAYSNTISATTLLTPTAGWKYRIVGGNRRGSLVVQGKSVFE